MMELITPMKLELENYIYMDVFQNELVYIYIYIFFFSSPSQGSV